MLWYKSWLDTRWQFLIGMALVLCSAGGVVFIWPKIVALMPLASEIHVQGEIGRRIREGVELSSHYRGFIWSQWFRQNLAQLGTLLAIVLGTGGLLSHRSAALFTLSLPVSRANLIFTRAALGLAELAAIVFIPSLVICLLSPAVGKTYSLGEALLHSFCVLVTAAAFFSLALLLTAVFNDLWRPLLIGILIAVALAVVSQIFPDLAVFGFYRVMSAETYFRGGSLPWIGLLACAAASAAMIYGAAIRIARQDF